MKIKISLNSEKVFNKYSDKIMECWLNNASIPFDSVSLLSSRTLELEIWDCCDKDYILKFLVENFSDFHRVEIYWPDLFIEPIIIY